LLAASFDGADFIREQTHRVAAEHRAAQEHASPSGTNPRAGQVTFQSPEIKMDETADADQQTVGNDDARQAELRRSSLAHKGLGPVILPPSDYDVPTPSGARGAVRTQIEKAIKFEIDRRDVRDHRRSAAIVDAIRETREAVRDTIALQLRDQDTLTGAISDTNEYLKNLQAGHSALHGSVVDIGKHTHEHGKSIEDLGSEISQLRDRVEQLSRVIERLTEKLQR
jgi:vacuolar-type H+-ATPase subunit I/STV1